jgi:hypothetical protein
VIINDDDLVLGDSRLEIDPYRDASGFEQRGARVFPLIGLIEDG